MTRFKQLILIYNITIVNMKITFPVVEKKNYENNNLVLEKNKQ